MFKAKSLINRTTNGMIALVFLSVQAIPLAFFNSTASAADTATLFPNGQGTYTAWTGDESDIDETGTPDCEDNDNDGEDNIAGSNTGDRESVDIDLSSVTNGSTITSVDVMVSYRDADSQGDDGTFQTFARLNGNNQDSGVNLVASSNTCTSDTQTIDVTDTVKNGGSTLEVGVLKTATDTSKVWVGTVRAVVTYSEAPQVQPVANPDLSQACGLDIALVLDNSQSITAAQRTQMKSAMTAFTDALNGTPTQFSVTVFGNSSSTTQAFTSNVASVNTAINNLPANPTGEYTNWQAGINSAQTSFSGGTSNPNLMIFATDGDPTASTAGSNGPVDETGYTLHLPPAITAANAAKTAGTRMLALGIGSPTVSRLQAISGPSVNTGSVITSDVITTNFSQLAAQLAAFAEETCGGTITTTKLIDHDSNPDTAPIKGEGWNFDVAGESEVTNSEGKTSAVAVDPGSYSVTETVKPGYEIVSASCKDSADTNLGQFNSATKSVEGINVSNSSIVSCEFLNRPTTSTLIVNKVVVGGPSENKPEHFSFNVNDGNAVAFEADGSNSVPIDEGPYNVEESNTPSNYTPSYSEDCEGTVSGGQTKTCTITNTYTPKPKLTLKKIVVNNNGGTSLATAWKLQAKTGSDPALIDENGSPVDANTAVTQTVEAEIGVNYSLSEHDGPIGYEASNWNCDGGILVSNAVKLAQGENVTCTITNDDIPPQLIIEKIVENNWGGTKLAEQFLLYLNSNPVTSGSQTPLDIGTATVSEDQEPGYYGVFGGDCDKYGKVALEVLGKVYKCTITNYDKPGKLIVTKKVINDDGGDKKAKDFRFKVNNNPSVAFNKYGVNWMLVPSGEYDVKELYAPGYKASYKVDGQPAENCDNITINNGQIRTCTIVNDDIAPKLTLKKLIGPEERYGNHTPSDWTLSANPYKGATIEGNGDPSSQGGVYKEEATAGVIYKLSESGPSGYVEGTWTCKGHKGSYYLYGDKLKLKPGANVACKIVNTEIAPVLTVKKHVINDDGGKATIEDFGLNINGEALVFDEGVYDNATKTTTYTATLNVYADQEHILSEKDLEGYKESPWTCSNEAAGENLSVAVSLSLGDSVTCEITNDDVAAPPQPPAEQVATADPSVLTLPKTTAGINPMLAAISVSILTLVLMSGSMLAKSTFAKRQ